MDAFAPSQAPSPVEGPPRALGGEEPSRRPAGARNALSALRLVALLLALALISRFFVIVPAGERGVLLRFGAVQPVVLAEGLHPLLPLRDRVKPMSVRVQSRTLHSEAASRDLQDVEFDLAVSWHLIPERAPLAYQRLGDGHSFTHTMTQRRGF